MASLTKRATVLIACRIMNYGVMILSPVFLVRIFVDTSQLGQYYEFILYVTLVAGIVDFGVNSNLIYFIPKYPDREKESVTHTVCLILTMSILGMIAVYFLKGLILASTHFDFIVPLMVYLFFGNFEFYETYWLGKKRTDFVLYYSSGRVVIRTTALIVSAFVSRDVMTVIWTLVAVECLKCLFVFAMIRGLLTRRIDRALLGEQLRFIVPIGSANVLILVNNQLANLVTQIKMGAEKLVLYRIGNQQIPIIGIIRSSVMDVLFPEMTQIGDAERLQLWRRANVVFCAMVFPVYAVFFFYARPFIETFYTAKLLAAVPLFRIYLTLMVIQCFEMATPLRAINQNKYFIFGSLMDLTINVGLILLLFRPIGFVMPALSFVVAESVAAVYLGSRILHFYRIPLRRLLLWRKIFAILCCAAIAAPVLVAGRWVHLNPVVRAVSFSILYLVVYYAAIRRLKIDEVELLVARVKSRLRDARALMGRRGGSVR